MRVLIRLPSEAAAQWRCLSTRRWLEWKSGRRTCWRSTKPWTAWPGWIPARAALSRCGTSQALASRKPPKRWESHMRPSNGSGKPPKRGSITKSTEGDAVTPDRWNQVKELFQQTLELNEDNRAAFLNQACGSEHTLRREVELLISGHNCAGNFIEAP